MHADMYSILVISGSLERVVVCSYNFLTYLVARTSQIKPCSSCHLLWENFLLDQESLILRTAVVTAIHSVLVVKS